ncbi:hypothetical protein [Pseudoduganella sp. RAF53_2]|uniref:hypothetical protein n=1 Tax=unclassified Pseudoduganella TaxID=2637179 RepID=UPI003F9BFB83
MAIYDKTVKGREEIASRCHHLAPRMRSLLVMIDGRHAIDELLPKVSGLGLSEANVQTLLDEGFIEPAQPKFDPPAEDPPPPDPATLAEQFRAAYEFYTRTIKPTLGMRGLSLQLKVEKASNIDELRELRIPFFEMTVRAKGRPHALQLRRELDDILS